MTECLSKQHVDKRVLLIKSSGWNLSEKFSSGMAVRMRSNKHQAWRTWTAEYLTIKSP